MNAVRKASEGSIQGGVVAWLTLQEKLGRLTFTHVPNGGKRSRRVGGVLKRQGVRAGFPDLIIFGHFGCGVIEMKTPTGIMGDEQIEWEARCALFEIPHAVCRSLEDVMRVVNGWMGR